jgi:hypothetical protein
VYHAALKLLRGATGLRWGGAATPPLTEFSGFRLLSNGLHVNTAGMGAYRRGRHRSSAPGTRSGRRARESAGWRRRASGAASPALPCPRPTCGASTPSLSVTRARHPSIDNRCDTAVSAGSLFGPYAETSWLLRRQPGPSVEPGESVAAGAPRRIARVSSARGCTYWDSGGSGAYSMSMSSGLPGITNP